MGGNGKEGQEGGWTSKVCMPSVTVPVICVGFINHSFMCFVVYFRYMSQCLCNEDVRMSISLINTNLKVILRDYLKYQLDHDAGEAVSHIRSSNDSIICLECVVTDTAHSSAKNCSMIVFSTNQRSHNSEGKKTCLCFNVNSDLSFFSPTAIWATTRSPL